MLRIEVKSNQNNNRFKAKVTCKHTHTLEAMYLMATVYNLIKNNDTTGITDKELFKDIKDMANDMAKQKEEK